MCASLSPDGRRVAVVAADAPGFEAKRRLKVIELPGGLTTELFEDPRLAFLARWAADGESLVTSIGDRVAAIPVAGGPPRQINLQITPSPQREEHLSIHPDGKRIAYMAGTSRVELWSFESLFTPAPKQ
jgi:hypothetical protein